MSGFSENLLPKVKLALRETSSDFDGEIRSYIDGCAMNLIVAGIRPEYFADEWTGETVDPQILMAIRLYCLQFFGLYNEDSEKYERSYNSVKATMCTNRRYTDEIPEPPEPTKKEHGFPFVYPFAYGGAS